MTTTNIQSFFGNVEVAGTLDVTGTLTSTTGVDKVSLAVDTTDDSRPIIFSTGETGSQSLKTDPGITYNPSTNVLAVTSNIGIGTSSPAYTLDVHGSSNVGTLKATTGTFSSNFAVNTDDLFVDTATGRVGVGTASPNAALHVKGGNLKIENTGSDSIDNKIIFAETGYNDRFFIGTDLKNPGAGDQHLRFGFTTAGDSGITNSNVIVNISGSSNVGIGTTTPAYKLDVHGTSNVGALTATSATVPNDGDFVMSGKPLQPTAGLHWDKINSRLGVGMTSPQFAVDVDGIINAKGLYLDGSAYTVSPWKLNANGNDVYYTTGNVGIGTTNPRAALQVNGNFLGSANSILYSHNLYFDTAWKYAGASYGGSTIRMIDSEVQFWNAPNDNTTADSAATVTQRMTIDAAGNVGIGTASPGAKLDVVGTAAISSNLAVNTDDLFVDTATGRVGVGTTNPQVLLDVAGSSNSGNSLQLRSGDASTGTDSSQIILSYSNNPYNSGGYAHSIRTRHNSGGDTGNAIDFWLWNTTDTTDENTLGNKRVMTIEGTGNVGIGTSSPDYKLDVSGTLHAGDSYFGNVYVGGSASRGLKAVSGNYGTVQTTGGGAGNWQGYSIDGQYVLMADATRFGMYNDINNEWMLLCTQNAGTALYYNGAEKLATTNTGVSVTGALTATSVTVPNDGDFVMNSKPLTSASGLHWDTANSRLGVGTASPSYTLDVNGTANAGALNTTGGINNGNYAFATGYMKGRTLTIGDNTVNYGGHTNTWRSDVPTAGFLMECLNNTEMAIHDAGKRVASFMYYEGDSTNRFTIGRNMGWGTISTISLNGNVGIGTTSPGAKLDVVGTAAISSNLAVNTDDFFVDTVTSNVGIGTSSPAYKLDVHGSANVGALTVTSVSGDGSGLTTLNAGNVSSGKIDNDRLNTASTTGAGIVQLSTSTSGSSTTKAATESAVKAAYDRDSWVTGSFSGDLTLGQAVVTPTFTEHPPGNMTNYTTTLNGGAYIASHSSEYSTTYRSWEAFDGNRDNSSAAWISANSTYSGSYTGTKVLFTGAPAGEWLKIQFPSAIVISHTDIYCRGTNTTRAPKNGFIYGSTNGTTWVQLQAFTNLTYVSNVPTRVQLNQTTTAYSYYAIVTTAISITSSTWVGIGEWELFSPGVTLTSDLTATTVSGDGSGLTNLNASELSSGTVPSASLSLGASDIPSLDATKITTGTLTRPISTTSVTATTLHYAAQTIQPILNGGGTVTYDASGNIKWSKRVIAIPVDKTEMGASGYIDITCPTSGTITYFSGATGSETAACTAAGIPMGNWDALYYVVTPGQSNASDQTKFKKVYYQNNTWDPDSNWILICTRSGDGGAELKWLPGQTTLAPGQSYNSTTRGTPAAAFADSATTATNQSGGTVSATTGTFSGKVAVPNDGDFVMGGKPLKPAAGLHWDRTNSRLGVGTTSPQGLLHLSSGTSGDAHLIIEADTDNNDESDNPKIVFRQDGGFYTGELGLTNNNMVFRTKSSTASNTGFIFYSNVTSTSSKTDLDDLENTDIELMRITGDGKVGIGTTSPSYKLHVAGDIYATGDVIMFSDERKKTNIEVIPNALEKVLQLRGVTFEKLDDGNRRHSGIIAQEVEKVLPEVVYTAEDGTKSVAYGNMIGLLIEAIKELAGK